MKSKAVLIVAAGVVVGAGAIFGFTSWRKSQERRERSDALLAEAREALTEAAQRGGAAGARDLRVKAAKLARESAEISDANAFDAWVVQGDAWLANTRYREAISALERALELRPRDANAIELAATAYHRTYEIGKKAADLGAALALYDRAADAGAPPRVLLAAATLARFAGEEAESDKYLDRLDQTAPDSDEAKTGRELRAAKTAPIPPR